VRFLYGPVGPDAATDVAFAHALVRRAGRGEIGPTLRVYRPPGPVLAFGRRDTLLPGFGDAVATARAAGFTPVVRAPGGRAVGYTEASMVVDHVAPDPVAPRGLERRFRDFGAAYAAVLRDLGVDARVGEVPGEYCPGGSSVNARGVVKLVGTAQRVVRGAWLFSAVVVVDGSSVLRPLLTDVYRHLGQPFDGASVGSVRDEAPGVDLDRLEKAVLDVYLATAPLEPVPPDAATLATTRELVPDHRL
jgi:lipoate-protein ligase A